MVNNTSIFFYLFTWTQQSFAFDQAIYSFWKLDMDMENQYQKDNYVDSLQAELYFLPHFKQTVSKHILFTGHLTRKTS